MNKFKKITAFILSLTLVLIPLNAEKTNNVKAESSSVISDDEYSAYKAGLNYPNSTDELVLADGDFLLLRTRIQTFINIRFLLIIRSPLKAARN